MLLPESELHTDEVNDLPWSIHPSNTAVVVDANGSPIASFEVRNPYRGVMANCDKNAELTVRAVNAFKKRGGADIRHLQERVTAWADREFPNRSMGDIFLKLYEEVGEYVRDPKSSLEFGDIMILLLDVAQKNQIDVYRATMEKMDINEGRQWRVDEGTRIMRHV